MELTPRGEKYYSVPVHQHDRHDVTCKPSLDLTLKMTSAKVAETQTSVNLRQYFSGLHPPR